MGPSRFDAWAGRITELAASPSRLLSLTAPLLISGLMQVFGASPSCPRDVLIRLLTPIVASPGIPLVPDAQTSLREGSANATITVVLIAGKVPFVLTCHSTETVSRWGAHLEAAIALLLPQIVIRTEPFLPEPHRTFMLAAIAEMLSAWSARRSTLGQVQRWGWQPNLM
jgi:hypothetical protein